MNVSANHELSLTAIDWSESTLHIHAYKFIHKTTISIIMFSTAVLLVARTSTNVASWAFVNLSSRKFLTILSRFVFIVFPPGIAYR